MRIEALSRRDFLKVAGAAGVASAVGAPAAAAGQLPHPDIDPRDLSFSILAQYRPFEIVARGFEAVDGDFAHVARRCRRIAGLFAAPAGPRAPYAAVQVDVTATRGAVHAGLIADAGDAVLASYDAGAVTIEVVHGGQRSELARVAVDLSAPFAFAFVLNENNVIALADTGEGFRPLARANVSSIVDLRDPATLARYRYAFGGDAKLARVKAGYWGKAGVRDPHVVTWADGTPFIQDGKLYLTLTNAGLGFFEFAHWGVYTLDLRDVASPDALRHVGKIFFERQGLVVGDHAGHLVYDPAIRAFRMLVSNWGTFSGNGVLINSAVARGDVLHGVTVIRNPTVLPLPTDVSRWDPHMVRIRGRWYVAFVESPSQDPFVFHPALARGPASGEFGHFALVGRDTERTMTEGMVMQKIGGRWYVLCSSSRDEGPGGGHYRIYDLRMRFLGFLDAPYPTNIPHPMVVPVPDGRRTRYLLVTFNGTQYYEDVLGYGTHGDFFVMEAAQHPRGYEFPPRGVPV